MTKYTTSEPTQEIPYGYCHCGCGEKTSIPTRTHRDKERIKGEPMRYISGHNGRKDFLARFWSNVKINDMLSCWEWTGSKTTSGYGRIVYQGKDVSAHRISYEMHIGPIPKGFFVCHHCDNPSCVNPSHLFVGTQADNMSDCAAKGRTRRTTTRTKFSDEQILDIRAKYATGLATHRSLSAEYGVAHTTIGSIVSRQSFKNIP